MAVKKFDSIPGLKVVDCPHFIDDRGFLMEILRTNDAQPLPSYSKPQTFVPGDDFGHSQADIIRQVYLVINPTPTVRAFHAHVDLIDYFCIVQGSAIFAFADDRDGTVAYYRGGWREQPYGEKAQASSEAAHRCAEEDLKVSVARIVTSARKPQMIVVPEGVYHGWASLEPNTIMVSCASTRYNTETPDERRIPPNSLDVAFSGSPWEVESK